MSETIWNTLKSLTYLNLFNFSSPRDKILITVGILCAIVYGQKILIMGLLGTELILFLTYASNGNGVHNNNPIQTNITTRLLSDFDKGFIPDIHQLAIYTALSVLVLFTVFFGMVTTLKISARNQTKRALNLYIESLVHQDMKWFDDRHKSVNLPNQTADDFQKFQDGIGMKFGDLISCMSAYVGAISYSFYLNWRMTLVGLCFTPFFLALYKTLTITRAKYAMKESNVCGKAGTIAEEVFSVIKTVVAFGGEKLESQRYSECLEKVTKFGYAKGISASISMSLLFVTLSAAYSVTTWFCFNLVRAENEDPSLQLWNVKAAIMIITLINNCGLRSSEIFSCVDAIIFGKLAHFRIRQLIKQVPSINNWKTEQRTTTNTKITHIQFHNVQFSYENQQNAPVIQNFNLDVPSGETIAIVGETGSGKSTLISLLLRFYDVTSGSISINGLDIRDYDPKWLRRQIGLVNQEPTLFPTTIFENIAYGKTEATREEIVEAAKLANAERFIEKLPSKYETYVGDGGTQLSGGQKQRLAIARALIRNPQILILDEATSALDTANEESVQEALRKAREGRTTFIIAHRLSTIRHADRIIVVSNGKIVEIGTHEKLFNFKGKYYEHVQSQFQIQPTTDKPTYRKRSVAVINTQRKSIVNGLIDLMDFIEIQNVDVMAKIRRHKLKSIVQLLKMNTFNTLLLSFGIFGSILHSVVFVLFFVQTLSYILLIFSSQDESLDDRNLEILKEFMVILGVLTAGFVIAICLQISLLAIVGSRVARELQKTIFNHFIQQDVSYFDDPKNSVGGICMLLSMDVENIKNSIGVHLGVMLNAFTKLITSVVFLYTYCWQLGLGQFVLLILGFMATVQMKKLQKSNAMAMTNAVYESNEILRQIVTNIRTVSSLGLESTFHENFNKCHTDQNYSKFGEYSYCILHSFVELWAQIGMLMVFVFTIPLISNNQITFLNIARALGTLIAANSMSNSLALIPNIVTAKNSLDRIFETIRYETKTTEIDSIECPTEETKIETDLAIEFYNVSFKYPMRQNVNILKNFTLDVKTGQTVALVGESGSGKSSCLQLLERFYEPYEGSISVNGKSIRDMNKRSLRRQMVIVQQEPALFDRSIAENIAYGDNTRQVTMEEIVRAAIIAQAHQFITELPQGYETSVGQRGAKLSGGQKQRIAIARALVRKSRIVLLDEATSALDAETEKAVHNSIMANKGGATVVLVAHRFSTINNSDLICVVKEGKIVEMGINSDLMSRKGHYYRLYRSQATNLPS